MLRSHPPRDKRLLRLTPTLCLAKSWSAFVLRLQLDRLGNPTLPRRFWWWSRSICAAQRTTTRRLLVSSGACLSGANGRPSPNCAPNPAVVFAEPNWFVYTAQTAEPATTAAESETAYAVDDPLYAELQWSLQRSNFSRAWQQVAEFAPAGPPIQVAVVDTGIDFEHPEFAGRLLPGYDYVTRGATPPIDAHGHGTHVAGLIAALANNAQGIAGSGAYVMIDPRRVFDETGSGHIANVAQAIRDAADSGARIINLSMQAPNYSANLEAAVEYARSRGVLLVAAAGNGRLNPSTRAGLSVILPNFLAWWP